MFLTHPISRVAMAPSLLVWAFSADLAQHYSLPLVLAIVIAFGFAISSFLWDLMKMPPTPVFDLPAVVVVYAGAALTLLTPGQPRTAYAAAAFVLLFAAVDYGLAWLKHRAPRAPQDQRGP